MERVGFGNRVLDWKGNVAMRNYVNCDYDYTLDDDVGKRRKKTQSGKSRSSRKSKHKHSYVPCLTRYVYSVGGSCHESISIASYCEQCGKIGGNVDCEKYQSCEDLGHAYRMYSGDELKAKYPELPIITVDSYYQEYVPLAREVN